MRAIAFGLAIFGLVAAASAQDIQKLKRTAKSPKELAVQGHVSIDDTCEARDLPEIDLDIPPKGGTVCMRPGMVRLATPWSGRTLHCIGKRISGVFVVYLPFGSFTGLDTMQFTVRVQPPQARTYEAEIRVEPGHAPVGAKPSGPQKAGPMPPCPAFVS
jgi:hypothetical protein